MSAPDPVRQPNEEPTVSPQSPNPVRFAGIANGRVAVKAATLDEVLRRLDEMGADRQEVEIWEAGRDSDKIEYVWSCRRIPPGRAGTLPGRPSFADNPAMQRNEELGRKISAEIRSNPNSPYAGKLLGIVNGQVAAVADSWDEVERILDQLGAAPAETLLWEADSDPDEVVEIW